MVKTKENAVDIHLLCFTDTKSIQRNAVVVASLLSKRGVLWEQGVSRAGTQTQHLGPATRYVYKSPVPVLPGTEPFVFQEKPLS